MKSKSPAITADRLISEASLELVMHHISSFQNNSLEAVLSDYTEESVLITPEATYTGVSQIRSFFRELMIHFPKGKSNFSLDKIVAHNDLVFITWHAKTPGLIVPLGSDSFIIKEGKIRQQTFVGQLEFITN